MQRLCRTAVHLGRVSPLRPVPKSILHPPYAVHGGSSPTPSPYPVALEHDAVTKTRAACRMAREVLDYARSLVAPGVTTDAIDAALHGRITSTHNAYPSPLNYAHFPKSVCTSVNNVAIHGIPDDRPLEREDIISIDVSLYTADGYHGDCCATYVVDEEVASEESKAIVQVAYDSMMAGVSVCEAGRSFSDIGGAIEEAALGKGMLSCPEIAGHGIGRDFHIAPTIYHVGTSYDYPHPDQGVMAPGMVFTVEPVVIECADLAPYTQNLGLRRTAMTELSKVDNWTQTTHTGAWAAQFEHTILITPSGPPEILTVST